MIARLRELLAAATPGPWYTTDHGGTSSHCIYTSARPPDERFDLIDMTTAGDAALIAAAVNSLESLLRVAEAAKALEHEVWCDSLPRGTWVPVGCNCWQSSVWHELAALEGGTHE